jgi:hypothetical protein
VRLGLRGKVVLAAVAIIGYFVAAYWLEATYVPDPNSPPPAAGNRVRLRPSDYAPMNEFSVTVRDVKGTFEVVGDAGEGDTSSPIELYENGKKLGPAHSTQREIMEKGYGRYLHERGRGMGGWISWSSSDNSNPMTNGRTYWLVNPMH